MNPLISKIEYSNYLYYLCDACNLGVWHKKKSIGNKQPIKFHVVGLRQ